MLDSPFQVLPAGQQDFSLICGEKQHLYAIIKAQASPVSIRISGMVWRL